MQEMALKNIRSSAAFADLLANDERISSSHPEDVAFHFNEISKVMPESTVNTAIMRPLLRKRLESGMGQVDPVDVEQMISMEKAMYGAPAERASREKDAAYGRGFIDPFKLKPKKPTGPSESLYKKYDEARAESRAKSEAEAKARAEDARDRKRELEDRAAKYKREDELAARKETGREPGPKPAPPKPAPPKPAPPKPAPTKKPVDPAQAHADALAKTRAQKVQKDQEDSAAKARQSAQAAEDASRKRQTGKYDAFSTKDVKPPNYSEMEEYKGP
jgi:hypothetical protein